ncbi:MAG: hypothetical protein AAFR59_08835, partial [Bacteroidota bacterium]
MIHLRNFILIALLVVSVLITACTQEADPVYTIVQGKLPADIKEAEFHSGEDWETFSLAADGTFSDTLEITSPQYVTLSFGDLATRVYLTPGDAVNISVDSALSFSGSNKRINDYLYQSYLDEEARGSFEFKNHEAIFRKGEVEYIQFRDSIRSAKLTQLEQLPAETEAFQDFHKKNIEYQYQYDVARYPSYHSYYFNDYEPTQLITSFHKRAVLDNEEDARHYSAYRSLVNYVLDDQVVKLEDTTLSPLEAALSVIKDIQSPTILHDRLSRSLNNFTVNDEDMEGTRDKLLSMAKLDRTKAEINEY